MGAGSTTLCANRFTSHCKKNSNLSRRQTAGTNTTADPESSNVQTVTLQHLRQITFARLRLLGVVRRISDRSAHPRR